MSRSCALFIAIAVTSFAVACAVLPVSAASAGTYTVHTCKTPTGATAGVSDWRTTIHKGGLDKYGSACPKGAFWLDMIQTASHTWDDYIHTTYRAPADTEISAYTLWRSVQLAPAYNYRYYELTRNGTLQYDACYPAQGCRSKGSASAPLGSTNRVAGTGRTDLTGLMVSITCGVESGACPAGAPGARFQLHRADIALLDRMAPVIASPPTGPLVSGYGPLAGVQYASLSATDRGGGVYEALFEVDGRVVSRATLDANGGLCKQPFTTSIPCKLSASGTVGLDTATLPDGPHTLRILVTDVTGTNVAAWGPIGIRTANATCNPEPRVRTLSMQAAVARPGKRRPRRAITVSYGRRVRLGGRLLTPAGAPVPGAPVCIATRAARAGAPVRAEHSLQTDESGRFSTTLGRGPSRRVYFVHRVAGGAVTASVAVRVRAPVRLRAPRRSFRNGERLVLRGRLGGRPRRGRGVLVELQARRASGWQTFGTTRTRRGGRFRYGYRFTQSYRTARYRMRARVPTQRAYPFAAGASRSVTVLVIG